MRRLLPAVFALALLPAEARADIDEFTTAARNLAADADTGPLTNGLHYFASNERDLDLVADAVQDTGEVVVAVAADPGYILAAWADARALVLIDLDPAIVALHRIYAAFFAAAPGPAEFSRLWTPAGEAEALALVKAAGGEALVETFVAARPAVARRFAELERHMASKGRAWLLSDPRLYARVAGLVRANRVIALRGDFTRAGTVRAVAETLRAADLRVGLCTCRTSSSTFVHARVPAKRAGAPLAGGQVLHAAGPPGRFRVHPAAGRRLPGVGAEPEGPLGLPDPRI
ncbi:hypothetical protein [Nannocystis pusilla]|uniref:LIC_10091 family protein n=1 Tax=Nannocystis pusilla TaxID=889268 RepID=UPI003B78A92D